MVQWTSAVGAPQLARLLASQRAATAAEAGHRVPAYRALADGVRLLVLEGRIPVAARLPAERELAAALRVSRTTVAAAFQALRDEDFLDSRRGSGSWTTVPAGKPLPTRGLEPLPPETAGSVIDLACATFPAPEPHLTDAFRGAVLDLAPYTETHGNYPGGLPALREALAARYTARGVPTMPEQIMVTTGAMGAVAALARQLVPRSERVAVEHPSYANVLHLLRDAGARLVPVPMADERGTGETCWDMTAWRQAFRESAPRMAYVIADYHNPTGALATDEQRREMVEAARAAGTVLVADESMTDLTLDGPGAGTGTGAEVETPSTSTSTFASASGSGTRAGAAGARLPRPMAAFDPGGSTVITVGSVSKAVWAGLRIGWVRAAPEVIRSLVAARVYADLGSPVLEQLAVARLLRGDGWEAAVAARRADARANRDALVAALHERLPGWEFTVPRGGLTLWVRTGGLSGSRIADAGERIGVRVPAGTRFGTDGAFEGYVRLLFTVSRPVADEAVARLARAADLVRTGAVPEGDVPRTYVA